MTRSLTRGRYEIYEGDLTAPFLIQHHESFGQSGCSPQRISVYQAGKLKRVMPVLSGGGFIKDGGNE
jgi:hypothetical protein